MLTTPSPDTPLSRWNVEYLRQLVQVRGYEQAISLLDQKIRETPPHAAFIQKVDALASQPPPVHQNTTIIVVPGALYKEYPETGADGRRFVEIVQSLGIRSDIVPVPTFGSLQQNAGFIAKWLTRRAKLPGERLILVSFSKGSADVKTALRNPDHHAAFGTICGWLSVGGILHGTPLVGWLNDRPIRHFCVRQLLRFCGHDPRSLQNLAHGPGTKLAEPVVLPPGLQLFHLVTLPTTRDLSFPLAKRAFHRLLPLGPNDAGGFMLGDLHALPGCVYPLQHTDHYLRNCKPLPSLLSKLLFVIANKAASDVR